MLVAAQKEIEQPLTNDAAVVEIEQTELTPTEKKTLVKLKRKAAYTSGAILGNLLSAVVGLLVYMLFALQVPKGRNLSSTGLIMMGCTTFVIDLFFIIWAYRSPLEFTDCCFSKEQKQALKDLLKKETSLAEKTRLAQTAMFLETEEGKEILANREATRTLEAQEWAGLMAQEKMELPSNTKAKAQIEKLKEWERTAKTQANRATKTREAAENINTNIIAETGEFLQSLTIPPPKKNHWGGFFDFLKRKPSEQMSETASLETRSHRSYSALSAR